MVVFLFGYEINLMKKKPSGRGEVFQMLKALTPTEDSTLLAAPLDISDNRVDGTGANNV